MSRRRTLPLLGIALVAVLAAGVIGYSLGQRRAASPGADGWFADEMAAGQSSAIEQLIAAMAQQQLKANGAAFLGGGGDALADVPFRTLRVRLAETGGPTSGEITSGRFTARAVVEYRLAVDGVLVGRTARAAFRLTPQGLRLLAVRGSGQDLWDHEPVASARSRHVLVLTRRGDPRLPAITALVRQARAQVDAFWTASWPRSVVAVLPSEPRLLDPLVDADDGSEQVAVTLWRAGRDGTVIRVVLNPDLYDAMPPLARQIVLRHEVTHVAQDALPRDGVPVWLVEGLAEYVGYRGTGFSDQWVGRELLGEVRARGVPRWWPRDAEFALDGEPDARAVAYQGGWAFCQMVADRYGEERLVPFYAAVSRAQGTAAERLDHAAGTVLDTDAETLLTQWQEWLRAAA